jgi:hypothetical protein
MEKTEKDVLTSRTFFHSRRPLREAGGNGSYRIRKKNIEGTEGQRRARGTERDWFSLFLWLLSVPLYPCCFPGSGIMPDPEKE